VACATDAREGIVGVVFIGGGVFFAFPDGAFKAIMTQDRMVGDIGGCVGQFVGIFKNNGSGVCEGFFKPCAHMFYLNEGM
jgi:hypothetical protein